MTSPTGDIIRRSPQDHTRLSAFSLIELILVLLLLSLSASMVSPLLGGFSRGRNSNDAAAHMLAIMQYAQEQAAMTSGVHRLHFDTESASYWITNAPGGVDTKINAEIGRTFTLPVNVTLKVEGSEALLTNRYIQFETDGSHDMAVIRIVDSNEKQVIIACPSPSESFRIGNIAELKEQGQ